MLVLLVIVFTVFVFLFSAVQLQQVQHLLYDHLKGSTQLLAAVGFS